MEVENRFPAPAVSEDNRSNAPCFPQKRSWILRCRKRGGLALEVGAALIICDYEGLLREGQLRSRSPTGTSYSSASARRLAVLGSAFPLSHDDTA